MHYTTRTHSKERGQLHNGLLFLLQGGQQAQKFLLYQEALRQAIVSLTDSTNMFVH